MPTPADIRRLSLGDLDQTTLEQLIAHGEDLLVERKRQPPTPPKLGAAAASFANTLGGWILLGVADQATVVGWEPPLDADVQSYLGQLLRKEVDPLPPFVADTRQVHGKTICVVRVFPSMDSPHIVRGTGAVYLRSSKGKEPVDDHRTLLELARRGEDAERAARHRLTELPAVQTALETPEMGYMPADDLSLRFIVRAAPLTVTPALARWALTQRAADAALGLVDELLSSDQPAWSHRTEPRVRPLGRGVSVSAEHHRSSEEIDRAVVVADSGGVLGIQRLRAGDDGALVGMNEDRLHNEEIHPLIIALAKMLETAEALGRVALDMWIVKSAGAKASGILDQLQLREYVSGELSIPASPAEVQGLTDEWFREIQRKAGKIAYE